MIEFLETFEDKLEENVSMMMVEEDISVFCGRSSQSFIFVDTRPVNFYLLYSVTQGDNYILECMKHTY